MENSEFKRNVAYKLRISDILSAQQSIENEKLKYISVAGKNVVRVNLVANVVEKYIQDGEKKYGSLTLDDGSGQIKIKLFGDDIDKFQNLEEGQTILTIGMLRSWNQEIYMTPEIIKKKEINYLLMRKIESEQKIENNSSESGEVKINIITALKNAEKDGGIEIDLLSSNLNIPSDKLNLEIKKLLEDGLAYEPRPGKLRWLG